MIEDLYLKSGIYCIIWSLFFLTARSLLTLLPGQWDRRQSCKYTLGTTFIIIYQNFLIACHKSFGHATIARHNIKHVLWRAIATRVAFYSRPGLLLSKVITKPNFNSVPRAETKTYRDAYPIPSLNRFSSTHNRLR